MHVHIFTIIYIIKLFFYLSALVFMWSSQAFIYTLGIVFNTFDMCQQIFVSHR